MIEHVECALGHRFAPFLGHPVKDGVLMCPSCMAQDLDETKKSEAQLIRALAAQREEYRQDRESRDTRRLITLQRQPTGSTCVHACLAMALGVIVEDVVGVFGEQAMDHRDLTGALVRCGVVHVRLAEPMIIVTGWYFAVVPSLNHRGGNHQVLLHFDCDNGRMTVMDPAVGERYKEDGSDLRGYTDLILFHPGGTLPRRYGLTP